MRSFIVYKDVNSSTALSIAVFFFSPAKHGFRLILFLSSPWSLIMQRCRRTQKLRVFTHERVSCDHSGLYIWFQSSLVGSVVHGEARTWWQVYSVLL